MHPEDTEDTDPLALEHEVTLYTRANAYLTNEQYEELRTALIEACRPFGFYPWPKCNGDITIKTINIDGGPDVTYLLKEQA